MAPPTFGRSSSSFIRVYPSRRASDPKTRPLSVKVSRGARPSVGQKAHPVKGAGAGAARARTAVPGGRDGSTKGGFAPVRVQGAGSPTVANVFGRGLGSNGVPTLDAGQLKNLAVDLDEMRRHQDRRERQLDGREARLIGAESIEALRLARSLADTAGLGGRMTYAPTGVLSATGGRLASSSTEPAEVNGYDTFDAVRPSTAPRIGANDAAGDGDLLFAAPKFRTGMFGGTGATRGGNVPSRGSQLTGGGTIYPGSRHALLPDIPMQGAGISSDQLGHTGGGGEAAGGAGEESRKELRRLRSIIGDLEPKLREALKEAQMATRRERTAVTQFESTKAAMRKKHDRVVEELAGRLRAAEGREADARDECRQLREELHKSEKAESAMRIELNALKDEFPELVAGKERYEALKREQEALLVRLEEMKQEAVDGAREQERLRSVARLAEQAREGAKVEAEEATRLLTTQIEQLHQAEKGVELLSRTNRLLEEQLEVFMKSDPKSQWQGAMKGVKKQEKANDERRLYERIIDMERRRSEAALAELALLRARVKGFENKITHCRDVLAQRDTELERAEREISWQKVAAEEQQRDHESLEALAESQLSDMRARQRRLVQQLRLALAIAEHHQTHGRRAPVETLRPARGGGRLVGPPPSSTEDEVGGSGSVTAETSRATNSDAYYGQGEGTRSTEKEEEGGAGERWHRDQRDEGSVDHDDNVENEAGELGHFGGEITLGAPEGQEIVEESDDENADAASRSTVSEYLATGTVKGMVAFDETGTIDDPHLMRPISPEATLTPKDIERAAKGQMD